MRAAVVLAVLCAVAAPAAAKPKAPPEFVQITAKEGVSIKPDKAYILYRTNATGHGPAFMRIPTRAELDAYAQAKREAFEKDKPKLIAAREKIIAQKAADETAGRPSRAIVPPEPTLDSYDFVYTDVLNLQGLDPGKALEKGEGERVMLLEATPGDFVLYGTGWRNVITTCMCLGTVGFSARAGEIVDLGTILVDIAWQKSAVPELAGETGLGASVNGHLALFAMALRPAAVGGAKPAALASLTVQPAKFRAVGSFVAPGLFNINRLAPVPGVLAYDEGRVVDVQSGKVAPDNF